MTQRNEYLGNRKVEDKWIIYMVNAKISIIGAGARFCSYGRHPRNKLKLRRVLVIAVYQ